MASTDAGLTNLVVATYSGNTYTSLALNGSSYISTTIQANSAVTNQNFTLEFWVNFSDYSANVNRCVYNNYTGTFAANCIYIGKHTSSNGNLSAWFGSVSTSTFSVQESSLPPAGWNHYAITRNGANLTLYRNGNIQSSNTNFSTTILTGITNFDQIGGNAGGGSNVLGYISGVRMVKGSVLYTANFSVNAAPLNNLFSSTSTTIPNNGNSVAFTNSATSYLTVATAPFVFGTNAFTAECWIYTGSLAAQQVFLDNWVYASGSYLVGQWNMFVNTTGTIGFQYATSTSATTTVTTTSTVAINTWYHIAAVRTSTSSNGFVIYINGVAGVTGTISQTIGVNTITGSIGIQTSTKTLPFNGYIASVRLTNALAVYTGAFTVPTGPLTATQSSGTNISAISGTSVTLLTCQTLPILNTPTTTNGYYYNYFTGSGYLTVPFTTATFGSSWTIEGWLYTTTNSGIQTFMAKGYGVQIYTNSGTYTLVVALSSNNTSTYFATGTIGTLIPNTWYHVALVFTGTAYVAYLNGVGTTIASSTTAVNTGTNTLGIGYASYTTSNYWNGYISNFRFTNGVAVYTGTFTVPTTPLSATQSSGTNIAAISGTSVVVLTAQSSTLIDNSTNTYTITNGGSTVTTSVVSGLFNNYTTYIADNSTFAYNVGTSTVTYTSLNTPFTGSATVLLTAQTSSSNIYTTFVDTSTANSTITNNGAGTIQKTPLFTTGNITLTPTFATGNLTYVSNVTSNVTAISITPTANDAPNATIRFNGNVTMSSGNSTITATSAPYLSNAYSASFTSGYIQIANSAPISVQGYSWTAEMWVNVTGNYTAYNDLFAKRVGTTTTVTYQAYLAITTGYLGFYNGANYNSTYTLQPNVWNHVVYTHDGSTLSIYVNGSQIYSAVIGALTDNAGNLTIGGPGGGTEWLIGNASNFRFTKGYILYQGGSFTVPKQPYGLTQPGSTNAITSANTSLLALQNSTTTDASSNAFTLTATGTPTVSTTVSPFISNYSVYLGAGVLTLPSTHNIFASAGQDFTIEVWVYYNSIGNGMLCGWNINPTYDYVYLQTTGFSVNTNNVYTLNWTYSWTVNTWYHVAISRISNIAYGFVNGTLVGSGISNSSSLGNGTSGFQIGNWFTTPAYYIYGYISNFRFIRGTGIYSSSFTPPTSPLLPITNTSLLTCQKNVFSDASVNNYSVTPSGSATINTFGVSTFVQPNASSVYFTGSSQYLNAPSNTVFTFGTGNFTVEGWIYLASGTTSGTLFDNRTASNSVSSQIYISSNIVYYAVGGTNVITGATVTANAWYHIAVTRISGITKLYVNGYQSGSTYTDTNNYVIGSPYIGTGYNSTNPLNGYITNLRVVNGVGVYNTTFGVPTSPLTITQSQIANTLAITGAPSNGYSGYFNGTSASLSVSIPAISTAQPFTLECWVYTPTALSNANGCVIFTGGTNTINLSLGAVAANQVAYSKYGVGNIITNNAAYTVPTANWSHIAISRTTTTAYLYINGVQVGSAADTNSFSAATYNIGYNSGNAYYAGYISNLRLVIGTALYTTTFSPSTTPLTPVTNTALLVLQNSLTNDASTNNLTLTNNGGVSLITSFSPYNVAQAGSTQFSSASVQYLSATNPYNPALSMGADAYNNFTAEAWIYMNGLPPASPGWYIMQKGVNATNGVEWSLSIYTNTTYYMFFQWQNGFTTFGTTNNGSSNTINLTVGQWNHMAITKVGTTITFWFNGRYSGSVNGVTNLYYSTNSVFTIANTQTGATTAFNGYISNARVVYGAAIYTADYQVGFNPTNIGLLSTTQSATSTTAAIQNASSYINSLGNSVYFNNSTDYLTFPEPTPYYSAFFDGSSGYLTTSSSGALTFGTNSFTVEFWVYHTASGATEQYFDSANNGFSLGKNSNNQVAVAQAAVGGILTSTGTVPIGQWAHIAVVRNVTSLVIYINGVSAGSTTDSTNYSNSSFYVGKNAQSAISFLKAYVSNMRMLNTVAVYTGNFTVPTSPLTLTQSSGTNISAITAGQTSLLAFQYPYALRDISANAITFSLNGGVTGSPVYSPFTTTVVNPYDVTIEAWVMLNAAPTTAGFIINNNASSTGYFGIAINTARTISVFSDSTSSAVVTSSNTVPLNQWAHIAVVYNNSTIYIYINGVKDANSVAKVTPWGALPSGTIYIGRQASAAAQYFPGYMTNVRMVYNNSLYLVKFTPPSSPFTAINNTVFLGLQSSATVDASIVNATITKNGTGLYLSTMTSPFSSYMPTITNGNSLAFGWQQAAPGTDFIAINTGYVSPTQLPGDFTIEVWMYMAALPSTQAAIIDTRVTAADAGYAWYVTSGGLLVFLSSNTGLATSNTVLAINTWYHLAISRQNGFVRQFINGAVDVTGTNAGDLGNRTQVNPNIGKSIGPYYWSGYLNNLRLLIGTAIYTGTFTPSIAPYSLTSSGGTNIVAVNGITTYPTATSPSGLTYSGSLYFAGNSNATSYMSIPNSGRFNLDTYNFTIEAWFYTTSSNANGANILSSGSATPTDYAWSLGLIKSTTTYFQFISSAGFGQATALSIPSLTVTVNLNTWYHIAVVRSGTSLTFYLNGINIGVSSLALNQLLGLTSQAFILGNNTNSYTTYTFAGYISNARVIRGYAVYTGNFTPSTSPLTNTQNSVTNINAITGSSVSLLALQNSVTTDASSNSFTLTATGSPTLNSTVFPSFTVANGYSGFFDGSTGYLSTNSANTLSGKIFTIEAWVHFTNYPTNSTGLYNIALFSTINSSNNAGFLLNFTGTATSITGFGPYAWATPTNINNAFPYNFSLFTWYHVAITRTIGGLFTCYVNGTSIGSFTSTSTWTDYSYSYIGYNAPAAYPYYFPGYISNLRLVNGITVYNSNFTPSTTPLTVTQSANTNGNPSNAITVNTYAGSFNGSNQYLTAIPVNVPLLMIGANNFTIEAWIFPTSAQQNGTIIDFSGASASGTEPYFGLYSGQLVLSTKYSLQLIIASAPAINTWSHVALVRYNGFTSIYLNGVQNGNILADTTLWSISPTATPVIGGSGYSRGTYLFTGSISNLRVVNGIAVYTGNFTVPAATLTNTQSSGTNISAIPTPSTSNGYYGAYFNGSYTGTSTDYLTIPSSTALQIGSNNFTIEFWINLENLPLQQGTTTAQTIIQKGNTSTSNFEYSLSIYNSSGLYFYYQYGTTGTTIANSYSSNLLTNFLCGTWNHIAVTKSSSTLTFWLNGVSVGSSTLGGTTTYTGTGAIGIGNAGTGTLNSYYFGGFISNLRLVNNQALYSGAFTPSTSPLTNSTVGSTGSGAAGSLTGTVSLLACQSSTFIDNSTNSATITKVGSSVTTNLINLFGNTGITVLLTLQNNTIVDNSLNALTFTNSNAVTTVPAYGLFNTAYTQLLALQNSLLIDASNNTTLTITGNVTYNIKTPFIVSNGSSVYFTGSSQYLNAPSNSVFTFGTNNFTIEGWIYLATGTSAGTLFDNRTSSTSISSQIYINANIVYYAVGGVNVITGSTVSANYWYHVAVVRISNATTMYVNGAKVGTTYLDGNNYVIGSPYIGTGYNTSYPLNGYISNLRITNGTGVYSYQFTPPLAPLSTTQSSSSSIIQLGNGAPLPYGNSVFFNGTTDYMKAPSITTSMGTGDFTIETYYYPTSFAAVTTLFGQYTAATTGLGYWNVQVTTAGIITVYYNGSTNFTASTAILINEWVHIALVRISGTITLYVNGVIYGTISFATQFGLTSVASPLYIGATQLSGPTQYAVGYMSNLRITKGIGVYTGAFTVPTYTLTTTQSGTSGSAGIASGQTSLLALQNSLTNDASTNNFTLTNVGGVTLNNVISPFSNTSPAAQISALFTSNSSYINIPSNSVFNLLSNSFTLESWVYLNGTGGGIVFGTGYGSTPNRGFTFQVSTTALTFVWSDQGTYAHGGTYTATISISLNTWYHVAFVRNTNTYTFYLNGVSQGTGAMAGSIYWLSTYIATIGNDPVLNDGYFNGYISNLRLVAGVPVYTGNFTVSVNPLSITQNSGTNINAITGNLYSNGYDVYITGSAYLSVASNSKLAFSTNDFTVEFWFNVYSATTQQVFYDLRGGVTANPASFIYINATSNILYGFGATAAVITSSSTVTSSTWNHVAVVRASGTLTMYHNGVSVGSVSDSTTHNQYGLRIGQFSGGTSPMSGAISNFRLVSGTAVYTSGFTPSATPLTAITNTVLLTCQSSTIIDNSSNAFTITTTGTSVVSIAYGLFNQSNTVLLALQTGVTDSSINALTLAATGVSTSNTIIPPLVTAGINGFSAYFTGSSQYITAPSSSVFTFGTNNFTIEGWIYLANGTTSGTLFDNRTGASSTSPQIYISSNVVNYAVAGTSVITGSTLSTGAWYHIAVSKISGSTKLFVNGSQSGSTYTDSNNYVIGSPYIGTGYGSSNPLNGYISNLRVVNGVGVYSTTFTPSSTPLSATQGSGGIAAISGTSVSLLTYQNSLYGDNSTFNYNITAIGNPQYSPVFSPSYFSYPTPVNGNSIYFNGTSSYLSLTQPSNAGTGDFTIELWIYPTSISAIGYLLSTSTTAANCYHLWVATTGAITLAVDSATASITSGTPSFAKVNAWTHVAITRSSGVVYMYVNGVRQVTTLSKATQFGDTGVLNIGRYQPTPGQYFTGYITNLRYVYGTAVYTGSYVTTPYTTPLTAITNTTLLLAQTTITKDNSTNNVTITNNNAILSTYTNPYTMLQLPIVLTGQSGTTGVARDNSMYVATITNAAIAYTSYIATVSPYGITPTLLLAQSTNSLYNDNSINNYTLSPSSLAYSPTVMPYITPFNGNNSIAFNGSTSYITGTNLYNTFGGDFTIEFFMMAPPQTASITSVIMSKNAAYSPSTTNNYYIGLGSPGGVKTQFQTLQIYNAAAVNPANIVFAGATPVCDSKWHHIAIVRISNIVTVYVDGVADTGIFSTTNQFASTGVWDYSNYAIGSNPNDGGATVAQLAYNGLLSNLRMINGVGIYTGNFTKPSSNLTTTQSSGTNIASFTPTIPSTTGYSWTLNSVASSYISITPVPTLNFGLNNYTIEFWHYLTGRPSSSTTPCFFSNYSSFTTGGLSMFAGHSSSVTTKYQIAFNGLTFPLNAIVSNSSIVYGKWTHIAVVRNSGVVYLYINGVLDSSSSLGNYDVYSNNNTWYIGATGDNTSASYLSGFISNFRVVTGIAVYTGNFTVPSIGLTTTQTSGTNINAISNSLVSNGGAVWYSGAGSNGYQSISNNYILNAGLSNITVEGWVYLYVMPTANTWTTGVSVLFGADSASLTTGVHFVIGSTTLFVVITNTLYGGFIHNMSVGNWYHLAYVNINNTMTFYVNGVSIGSVFNLPSTFVATTTYIGTAAATSGYGLNGYISNLRVIKSLGIYTSNFTPSTNPFTNTQSAVTNINSVTSANVSLLALQNSTTTDASSNNFTLTASGSPTVSTSVYPNFAVTNGYSAYMQVSSTSPSSLQVPSSASISGTATFTIECWIYPLPFSGTSYQVIAGNDTSGGLTIFGIYQNGLIFYGIALQSIQGVTASPANFNAWNHLALVRNANTGIINLYVNGVLGYTGSNTTNYTGGIIRIGTDGGGSNYPYTGYISNLRIVNGVAVYSSTTFTVPTTALTLTQTANSNGNPSSALAVNAYAAYLNGANGAGVNVYTTNGFKFGSGNFTIEFWVYNLSFTGQVYFTGNNQYAINISSGSGSPTYSLSSNGTSYDIASNASFGQSISLTTWYHFALVRNGNIITPYINGSPGTATTTSASIYNLGTLLDIGYAFNNTLWHTGYISNFRITNGVAVYTGLFTTPSTNLSTTQSSGTNISAITSPITSTGYYELVFDTGSSARYLTLPGTSMVFGTGAFTIECWVYMISFATSPTILANYLPSGAFVTNQWYFTFNTSGNLSFLYGGASTYTAVSTSSTVPTAQWVHLAAVRTSTATNGFAIYINGVSSATGTISQSVGVNQPSTIGLSMWGTISNIRITNGVAVYTGAFTVPTSPLTATQSSGTNISAITGTSVTLLTAQNSTIIDNSTFAYTITNVGSVPTGIGYGLFNNNTGVTLLILQNSTAIDNSLSSLSVFTNATFLPAPGLFNTPLVQLLSLQNSLTNDTGFYNLVLTVNVTQFSVKSPFVATNGSSIQFTGSSQYLNAPSNSVFTFGTNNFTIEGWIYLASGTTGTLYDSRTASNSTSPQIYINANTVYYAVGGTVAITGSTISISNWYHIAVVSISNITKLYVNGVQVGSSYVDSNNYVIGSPYIGTGYNSTYPLNGYISNIRVTNGVGVYTSNFAVPTTPLSITQNASTNSNALTALPSNYYSGYFATGWLTIAPTSGVTQGVNVGATSFTAEAWINLSSLPAASAIYTIMQKGTISSSLEFSFAIYNSSGTYVLYHQYSTNGSTASTIYSTPISITTNTWYHVAMTRVGATITFFLNGIVYPLATVSGVTTAYYSGTSVGFSIGSTPTGGNYFAGYISNVRLVTGVVYPVTFTPSTTPLPAIQNSNTNGYPSNAIGPVLSTGYYSVFVNSSGNSNASQYLVVPGNAFVFGTNPFTVELWINPTSFAYAQNIIDNFTQSSSNYMIGQWQLTLSTSGIVSFTYANSATTTNILSSSIAIPLNAWSHIAAVRTSTGAGGFVLYINGAIGTSGTISQGIGVAHTSKIGNNAASPSISNMYLTNIRHTYGVAVYTSTFTPPVSPLSVTQSSGILTQSSLLALQSSVTTDASVNNFTLTNTGGVTLSTTVTPFATQSVGGSLSFNGTSNYLQAPSDNSQFLFGTSNFTIECWFNTSSSTQTYGKDILAHYYYNSGVDQGWTWTILRTGGSTMAFSGSYNDTNALSLSTTNTITPNVWHHAAVVRNGSNASMYLDGVRVATSSSVTFNDQNTMSYAGISIGSQGQQNNGNGLLTPGGTYFDGYISNLRMVKGTAVYDPTQTTLTVPTAPLTAIANTVILLGVASSGSYITDSSTNAFALTNTGSVSYNSSTPFTPNAISNGDSVYFTGSSQYLNAPSSSAFTFGTNNFTIEGWIYLASGTTGTLYDGRTSSTSISPQIYINNSIVTYAVAGSSAIIGSALSPTTWYHIAVVRSSGSTTLYVNGTQSGSTYTDGNNYVIGSPYIGTGYSSSNPLNGYITNLRVTPAAVYTTNFTAPSAPLSANFLLGSTVASIPATTYTSNGYYCYGFPGISVGNSGLLSAIALPGSPLVFGTNPFTIEGWIYSNTFIATQVIIDNYISGANPGNINQVGGSSYYAIGQWQLSITTTGTIQFTYATSASAITTVVTTSTITLNTWYHIAVVRTSTSANGFVIYINGVAGVTATLSASVGINSVSYLGMQGSTESLYFAGLMSNIRITNIAVYTGAFTVPTGPLQTTQSSGTNIAAISGTQVALLTARSSTIVDNSTFAYTLTPINLITPSIAFGLFNNSTGVQLLTAQNSTYVDNSINNFTITNVSTTINSVYGLFGVSLTQLLALQTSLSADASVNGYTLTQITGTPLLEKSFSPFGSNTYNVPTLLTNQSGVSTDSSYNGFTINNTTLNTTLVYQTTITPYGIQTPTTLLAAQTNTLSYDATGFYTNTMVNAGTVIPVNTVNGPFNNDVPLLTLQNATVEDNSNNKAQMTIFGAAVSPSDNNPFTTTRAVTGFLTNLGGYNDISFANAYIANSTTAPVANLTFNPFTIPSTLVSVLSLQTNNTTFDSSINNWTWINQNTAPTSSSLSPYGTYYANGILPLTTQAVIANSSTPYTYYGNFSLANAVATTTSNIVVTAGDGVTTNTYSVTINSLSPLYNSNNIRLTNDTLSGLSATGILTVNLSNANLLITDAANANVAETVLTSNLASANYARINSDPVAGFGTGILTVNLSNANLLITDAANANLAETVLTSNLASANYTRSTSDPVASFGTGILTVNLSNANIFITDAANANLAETVLTANLGNANYSRYNSDPVTGFGTGYQGSSTPSPVGGVVLLITYSYTDGVPITAANVSNSSGSGSFASNTQLWYQT